MKKASFILILLIILSFAVSIYFYNSLPAQISIHWNAAGDADGYGSKFIGLFLVPLISIGILLLYLAIPLIDPLRKNIQKFRRYYDLIFILLLFFILYIHALTIVFNLGYVFNFSLMIIPAMAVLFFFMGGIMINSKRNWFVGIRTPWTLSSDVVWDKTHKLGGRLFQISGIIALIGIFFGNYIIWFILVPIIVSAIVSFVYSYIVYRSINNMKKRGTKA